LQRSGSHHDDGAEDDFIDDLLNPNMGGSSGDNDDNDAMK
jgi:hypothetical protein